MSTSDGDRITAMVELLRVALTDRNGQLDPKAAVVACTKLAGLLLKSMAEQGEFARREAIKGALITADGMRELAAELMGISDA